MEILFFLLLTVGALCFGLTASGRAFGNVNLMALGLLAWILVSWIQSLMSLE